MILFVQRCTPTQKTPTRSPLKQKLEKKEIKYQELILSTKLLEFIPVLKQFICRELKTAYIIHRRLQYSLVTTEISVYIERQSTRPLDSIIEKKFDFRLLSKSFLTSICRAITRSLISKRSKASGQLSCPFSNCSKIDLQNVLNFGKQTEKTQFY